MELKRHFEDRSTRLVFWSYAALTWAGGFLLFSWGPMWFGTELPGLPFGRAALIRLAGAAIMAAGCFAAAMAGVADVAGARRGMLWFAGGHAILWAVVLLEQKAIWGSALGDAALVALYVPMLVFFLFRGEPDPHATTLRGLLGLSDRAGLAAPSPREREIREDAGREERNRLARDLHDSIKQQLFAIQTAAATAQARFEPDPEGARGAIAQVRASAREAMAEMEVMLDQLRAAPLENTGLVDALKRQFEAFGFRTGAKVAFTLGELPPAAALPAGSQQALFRIAQEALSNIARHARAGHVKVALATAEGFLKLTLEDDGAGFQPSDPAPGVGIRNMRERIAEYGGIFEIESSPGCGTRLSASIPISSPSTEREYLKKAGGEAIGLLLMLFIALFGHSSSATVLIVYFGIRLVRALLAWHEFRRSQETLP